MRTSIQLSVIITTYNRPDALKTVLSALSSQTIKNFEVIIADDGSTPSTQTLITTAQKNSPYPIHHVWQADQGFQAAKIRNKAAAITTGNYLIFLDGDCIPRPDFLEKHQQLSDEKYFVAGNRILLSKAFTEKALQLEWPLEKWRNQDWLLAFLKKQCNAFVPLLSLPLGPLRKTLPNRWQGAKTCNLGLWKKDFIKINGFDEQYTGWGYEDSDLVVRLIRSGIKRKEGRFKVPVIHLWHAENDQSQREKNHKQLSQILQADHIWAKIGVDQYPILNKS